MSRQARQRKLKARRELADFNRLEKKCERKPKQKHVKHPPPYNKLEKDVKDVKTLDRPEPINRDLECLYWRGCNIPNCLGCKRLK